MPRPVRKHRPLCTDYGRHVIVRLSRSFLEYHSVEDLTHSIKSSYLCVSVVIGYNNISTAVFMIFGVRHFMAVKKCWDAINVPTKPQLLTVIYLCYNKTKIVDIEPYLNQQLCTKRNKIIFCSKSTIKYQICKCVSVNYYIFYT